MNLNLKEEYKSEKKPEKIAIIDSDSILYFTTYAGKDPNGERLPEFTERDLELLYAKLSESVLSILSKIEERYELLEYYLCIKGVGNFRTEIYPEYKSNRPPTPEILKYLYEYLEQNFKTCKADGFEADDVVYTLAKSCGEKALICGMDKDLRQIPGSFYDYFKDEWFEVYPTEARYNLAIQMCIGDPSDGINFTKGIGIKTAQKMIHPDMTDYQYIKAIYPIYEKRWGQEAKEKMKLAYKLLKLQDIDLENCQ